MKTTRQLLSLLFAATPLSVAAQHIDTHQATQLAAAQLESAPEALSLVYTASDPTSGEPTYYAFNREGGGFALVAADDRLEHVVLAYNFYGAFDYSTLSPDAQRWMEGYAHAVSAARQMTAGATAVRHAPRRAGTRTDLPAAVPPLIGDPRYAQTNPGYIFWTQYSPFNDKCPTKNGERCATGCVATSMAMVMSKHKWPSRGQGEISYQWNGETLYNSFDHDYNWSGGLLYRYGAGQGWSDYNDTQADFISTLLRDCGYSVRMNYGTGYDGSGAAEENACKALYNYFKYDKSVGHLCRDYCTNDYWEDLLRSEIAAGRPIMYGGGSDYGAHEFTCDGYDAEGRFYFHFGTSGIDGYYATLDGGVNYTSSQTAIFRIMPNNDAAATGVASVLAGSNKDFLWREGNTIGTNVRFFTPVEATNVDLAVAVENVATGLTSYVNQQSLTTSNENNNGTVVTTFTVSGTFADGEYNVFPVYRKQGAAEWEKVLFGEYCQDHVTLRVSGGQQTFSNESLKENIDEGKVKVDGIVYILNTTQHTAAVTFQNSGYNTYRGDVTVPETFSYGGQTYTVTSIGEKAFYDCSDATSVTLPATVSSIAYGAFYKCKASSVTFTDGSQLRSIANYGFAYAGMTSLVLPEGLTSVGGESFVGCYELTNVVLPTTLASLPKSTFSACSYIRNFTCKTATPPSCSLANDPFENVMSYSFPAMTLYVPAGSADAYRSHEVWGRFGNIVEGEGPGAPDTPDPGTGGNSTDDPIPGTYSIQLYGTDYYFSTAQVNGYTITTCSLSDKPEYFYIEPVSDGYTITSAKNDRKIGYSTHQGDGLSVQDVCDVASAWTIEDLNGGMTRILRKSSGVGIGADGYDYASAIYTNQSANLNINCYWTLSRVEGDPVLATAIELSETEAELKVGETLTVSATITPANVSKKTVAWESTNTAVASVKDGVITAISAGEAIIIATTTDGSNQTAFIVVTVTQDETPVDPTPDAEVEYVYSISPATDAQLYFCTTEVADHELKTYSLAAEPEYFRIVKSGTGFTLQSTRTGKYVGYDVVNTWDYSDDATTWTIANFEQLPPAGSAESLTTTLVRWHATKNTNTGFGCDTYAAGQGVYTDKANTLQWIIHPVAYEGDTVGLVANMIRRAGAGKCTLNDINAVIHSTLKQE